MWQEFAVEADERFVALGADVWDGTAEQVHTRWRLGKGVTMPLLLNASRMASDYGQSYQTFAIIDHEGLIRFKSSYLIPMEDLRDEVLLALADIPTIEEEVEETGETTETTAPVETAVETSDQASVPQAFSLAQNAPNPFNSNTVIRFALPQPSQVELAIYNLLGQPVAVLVQGPSAAGTFSVRWDGRDQTGRAVTSGVYLYQLRAGEYTEVRKLLLLR
ncbi:MAG: T9SS type A sorting domain-containing protein [Gemmatimonadetes bacterium]|nr:T9SS type A sorting domain-containing protein [Gemmatimonadota bacterium]